MMRCDHVLEALEDLIHDHLGPDTATPLREHLHVCPACRALHQAARAQRDAVAGACTRVAAPTALRTALIRRLAARQRRRRYWWAAGGAVAASFLLGAMLILTGPGQAPAAFEALVEASVEDHIRVVLRQRAAAAGPGEPEALVRLMGSVLDFPVPLPRAAAGGFRLEGGRPSYVAGQPVACFYYRAADRFASLFVVPLERLGPVRSRFVETPRTQGHPPHRVAYWTARGYAYVLVSDVGAADLLRLAQGLVTS